MTGPRILLVSNGFGEDLIAAKLGTSFVALGSQVVGFPIVGDGAHYRSANIPTINSTPLLPSGGFIRTFWHLIRDIFSGLIGQMIRNRSRLKAAIKDVDRVIVVGDVFALWLARSTAPHTIFIPTAKSDTFMPHSAIEYWLIRRLARASFPRDAQTRDAFIQHRCDAAFYGNPMMDNLLPSPLPPKPESFVLGLLPGSRQEALKNLALLLDILTEISLPKNLIILLSKAPQIQDSAIANILNSKGWKSLKKNRSLTIATLDQKCLKIEPDFSKFLALCDAGIGLAGTANEQLAFLNRPVFTFKGAGPQSRLIRFQEQQLLMGPAIRVITAKSPRDIAAEIQTALGDINRTPLPENQSAAQKITQHILTHL